MPEPGQGSVDAMRESRVAPGGDAQLPSLHGQLDPVRAHVNRQVTVRVRPAGGDRGGSRLTGLRQ
jgi:hypothetical protein